MRTPSLETVKESAGICRARPVIKSECNELCASGSLRLGRHYPNKQQDRKQHCQYLCKFSHIPFPKNFYLQILYSPSDIMSTRYLPVFEKYFIIVTSSKLNVRRNLK